MISSSPTAGRGHGPTTTIARRPLPKSSTASASSPQSPEAPRGPPSVAGRPSSPSSPRANRGVGREPRASAEASERSTTTKQPPPAPPPKQDLRGHSGSQDAPAKDKNPRKKKTGTERYLLGLGGYDASEYRQYQGGSEIRAGPTGEKGAAAAMAPGSKGQARSSKASTSQSSIFSQPRDRNTGSVNPAAEAASKSSSVNPAPRLRAGSVSTAPSNGRAMPATPISQPVFKHEGGRRWLRDSTLVYPLPVDLEELHRQSMRLVLMMRLFAAPFCNKTFLSGASEKVPEPVRGKQRVPSTPKGGLHGNPPTARDRPVQVLEVGCGGAVWSGACHDYLVRHGHRNVHFVGMDIAPLAPDLSKTGVNWRFVQWDLRQSPWPFEDGEFDFIFFKDVCLCGPAALASTTPLPETMRILKKGGVVEFWESDYVYRTLLSNPQRPPNTTPEEAEQAEACAAYVINASTPFVPPQNKYLADVNAWMTDALMKRELSPSPCGMLEWALRVESEKLTDVDSRRIALPFDHTRWEREAKKNITPSQAALRRTALLTSLQFIMALEPLLSSYSEKTPDEWGRFWTGMMRDLLDNKGAAGGECLEMGAWWAVRC